MGTLSRTTAPSNRELADLGAAHGAATSAAALVLGRRIEQHNLQGGCEPRMVLARHLFNITASVGQLAHQLAHMEAPDPRDVPSPAEVRGEVIYLGTAVLGMLEELEHRRAHAPREVRGERAPAHFARYLDESEVEPGAGFVRASTIAAEELSRIRAREAARERPPDGRTS